MKKTKCAVIIVAVAIVSVSFWKIAAHEHQKRLDDQLIDAVDEGRKDDVLSLVKNGANINAIFARKEWSPLTVAAYKGKYDMVIFLIENGADVNCMVGEISPLNSALSRGHVDIANYIIEKGGRLNLPKDARSVAYFIKLVEKYGGKEAVDLAMDQIRLESQEATGVQR